MLYKANLATFSTYCYHTVKTVTKPLKSHGMSKAVGENLVLCSEAAMIRKQGSADLKKQFGKCIDTMMALFLHHRCWQEHHN